MKLEHLQVAVAAVGVDFISVLDDVGVAGVLVADPGDYHGRGFGVYGGGSGVHGRGKGAAIRTVRRRSAGSEAVVLVLLVITKRVVLSLVILGAGRSHDSQNYKL